MKVKASIIIYNKEHLYELIKFCKKHGIEAFKKNGGNNRFYIFDTDFFDLIKKVFKENYKPLKHYGENYKTFAEKGLITLENRLKLLNNLDNLDTQSYEYQELKKSIIEA